MSLGGSSIFGPSVPQPANPTQSTIMQSGLNQLAAQQSQLYNLGAGTASQAGSLMPISTPTYATNYAQIGTGPGGVPIYGASQTLSPEQQQLYNQYTQGQLQLSAQAPNIFTQGQQMIDQALPLYGTGATALGQGLGYLSQGGGALTGALGPLAAGQAATGQGLGALGTAGNIYGQGLSAINQYAAQNPASIGDMASGLTGQRLASMVASLQPFQQTERDQLDTRLRNQGLMQGNPAYDNAMRQLDTNQNLAVSNFLATAEPQAWQQAMQQYQLPLTTAQAYQGMGGAYGGLGQLYGGLGGVYGGLGGQYTGLGGAYGGLAGQAGGLGTAYGQLATPQVQAGLAQSQLAFPLLGAGAPAMPGAPLTPGLNIPAAQVQPANLLGAQQSYNTAAQQAYAAQQAQYSNALQGIAGLAGGLGGLFG